MTPRKPPTGSEIVLRVENVHAEHERVLGSGWPLADPLEKRPCGLTDFRVFDPSGQYIRVTSDRDAPTDLPRRAAQTAITVRRSAPRQGRRAD